MFLACLLWFVSCLAIIFYCDSTGVQMPLSWTAFLPNTILIFGSTAVYYTYKYVYKRTHLNKTKIVQLRNGKYAVYQYAKYETGHIIHSRMNIEYFWDYDWLVCGDTRMWNILCVGYPRSEAIFDTLEEARERKQRIDEFHAARLREQLAEKNRLDGMKPCKTIE